MVKRCFTPALLALLGLTAGLLQFQIWRVIYDPMTQLLLPSPLPELFLTFIVIGVASLICCRLITTPMNRKPGLLPKWSRPIGYAAAVNSVAAGSLQIVQTLSARTLDLIALILGVLLVIQGGAMGGIMLSRHTQSHYRQGMTLLVLASSCYWLVGFYHSYGDCPIRETYLWPLLAGIACCWCWLGQADRSFGTSRRWLGNCMPPVAALLCCAGLPAPLSLPFRLSILTQIAWLWMLCLPEDEPVIYRAKEPIDQAADT